MKVVFIKNVENTGKIGEVKEVADGFARNFLIPNGLAEPASTANVQRAKISFQEKEQKEEHILKQQQEIAEKIEGREFVIKAKAKDGKLFGSIDQKKILEKLAAEGTIIPKDTIKLEEPIKELGEKQIKISLGHGIEANIKVIVEDEK